jgi:hypothetical protein
MALFGDAEYSGVHRWFEVKPDDVGSFLKQLQADKAEAIDAARTIETEINDLISYLCCDKFRVDTRVQVGDVLRTLLPIRNNVSYIATTLSRSTYYTKNK